MKQGCHCERNGPLALEQWHQGFAWKDSQATEQRSIASLSELALFGTTLQKFKPKSVLENSGDCGDKQLRGGWSLHEIIKLNHLPASLPERTRREKSAKDWLQKLPLRRHLNFTGSECGAICIPRHWWKSQTNQPTIMRTEEADAVSTEAEGLTESPGEDLQVLSPQDNCVRGPGCDLWEVTLEVHHVGETNVTKKQIHKWQQKQALRGRGIYKYL